MRVNAISYLQTKGCWDGNVWRANWFSPRIRLNIWLARFISMKTRAIKKAMAPVSL